jgi:hypothetical protein
MTTIAWDGRFLAADTRTTLGDSSIVQSVCHKLIATEYGAYASTGRIGAAHLRRLIEWWEDGRGNPDPRDMPLHGYGDAASAGNFIVITTGAGGRQALMLSYLVPYGLPLGAPQGWGSGGDYAMGAMKTGASAMRAVAVAAECDACTGGDVEFIDTTDLARGVQQGLHPTSRKASSKQYPGSLTEVELPNGDVLTKAEYSWFIAVRKPRKVAGEWNHDCTGRLINGTGCGHCLRCNREWHAMLKRPHETTGSPDMIQIRGDEVERVLAEHPIPVADADLIAIQTWVDASNDARACNDTKKICALDAQLKGMQFPAGWELVVDAPDAECPHWRHRLVSHEVTHVASHEPSKA